jgi:hypothetical protein
LNLSAVFITRPVATTLLTVAVLLAGTLTYGLLPRSALPLVEYPTIRGRRTCHLLLELELAQPFDKALVLDLVVSVLKLHHQLVLL